MFRGPSGVDPSVVAGRVAGSDLGDRVRRVYIDSTSNRGRYRFGTVTLRETQQNAHGELLLRGRFGS